MSSNRCSKCGRPLDPSKEWPFSITLGGAVCLDCLPPDARKAWEGLGRSMEELRELSKPMIHRFREAAVHRPVHDLIVFWRKAGLVHTSLTSLTHEHTGKSFSIVWSEDFPQGVESHDNYARNFNEGIKYPNIRMSGLADFEHMRLVKKPTDDANASKGALEISEHHGQDPLSHREGNAVFARSIAEVMIVAMHAADAWGLTRAEVDPVTGVALASLISANGGNAKGFEEAWRLENLGAIYDDVQVATKSDVLELRRFVRCGELFLMCLERWT